MPRYDYRCADGHVHEEFFAVASLPDRDAPEPCPECGKPSKRCIVPVAVFGDIPEHFNVQFDEPVRGRKHFKEMQKKYGTVDYDARAAREHQSADWKTRWKRPSGDVVINRPMGEADDRPRIDPEAPFGKAARRRSA